MMATAEPQQHPEEPQEHVVSTSVSLDLSDRLQRLEQRQRLLARLVLALICAPLVGGCCFFRLLVAVNSNAPAFQHFHSHLEEVSTEISPVTMKPVKPERPAARLPVWDSRDPFNSSVVHWPVQGSSLLREMDYKDGRLIVKQEGFYFLYSKVGFFDSKCVLVHHKMMKSVPIYEGGVKPFELMQSTRYHCPKRGDRAATADVRSSYLGGVFHLYANDSIYVALEGQGYIRLRYAENFFGAFML